MELAKLAMISLQRQALTNFASFVWVTSIKKSLRSPFRFRLHLESLNDGAIDDLERSNIPSVFKEMTLMILAEVGFEIFDWLSEIEDGVTDITLDHQVSNLSWTIEGSLNRPKMTRLLLENQRDLGLTFSFKMACEYCLEDKVRELWPRIREDWQSRYFGEENWMVQYWIYKLDGHLLDQPGGSSLEPVLDGKSIEVQFFIRIVRDFNIRKPTVKFLFNNLSEEEKIKALDIFFDSSNCVRDDLLLQSEVLGPGYLLSQLNYTQMCKLVSEFKPKELLRDVSIFAWPNTHFLKALDHYIGQMEGANEATNGNDLDEFADGAFEFVSRYNRSILFRYCWARFPREVLNKAIDSMFIIYQIISVLVRNEDDVSIKMVIDSIDPNSYANIFLSHYHLFINETLARYDTDLLQYYLSRTVVDKNLAKNMLIMLKDCKKFPKDIKEAISGILIELFPELDPNSSD